MQSSLIDECPSLLLGTAAYTQAALAEILKQPACQKLAAAILSSPLQDPTSVANSLINPTNSYSSTNPKTSGSSYLPEVLAQKRNDLYISQNFGLNTTETMFLNAISDAEMDLLPLDIRLFLTTIFLVLSIMGIIGNLMVITVVLKVPGMITPTNCYLMSLAASDCLFFVGAAPTEFVALHVTARDYIFGHIGCAFLTYIPYLAINTSSLSITAFTIERFIGICYPLRARYICTVSRAKLIIVIIWSFCLVYDIHWFYLASITEDSQGQACSFKLQRDSWAYKVVFLFDFTVFYLIPMILYVIIYSKITYTLTACSLGSKGRQPFRKLPTSNGSAQPSQLTQNGDSLHKYSISSSPQPLLQKKSLTASPSNEYARNSFINTGRKGSSRGRVQVQIIKMLAVVVLIFAVCWLPYRAMVVYNSFASIPFIPQWYIMFAKIMIFFNCAINPILYNLMSARFRNAFRRLLRGKNSNKDSKQNCTVTLSRPLTATTSMRPDDLRPFLSPTHSSPEHEIGSNSDLVEKV